MPDVNPLAQALSDRYAIERELGQGGMATVYLAEDLKHKRKVAVKVLRPELVAAIGSERFLREIEITANLNHPHILPLLDSGKAVRHQTRPAPGLARAGQADSKPAEFLYYVMPYVEGESLRERLNREKQLAIDDALSIATEVADGLGSAHRQGVVHRDIKPENILLREGHALVADFGIALAVTSAGGDRLTETGLSLGTPAYMSPEQVAGERDIDARSDIYSLACVLYEMLAGDPPFVASSPRAVLAKHMTDLAPPITTVRSSVPPAVVTAITKALGKAPADRFDSAKALSEALFEESTETDSAAKSIAVLPFANLSADREQDFFCDGMTEELINALTHVQELKVIARTSTFAFKDRQEDVRQIGKKLDVNHILEGSVRKAGNRLRVSAQLIKVSDGTHVWSERFDREMQDVFTVQDEIALAIVDTLKVRLLHGERDALTKRYTDNVELYKLYLLGRHYWNKFTPEGLAKSIQCYEQAIEKDPDYALAYSGAAEVQLFTVFFVDSRPRDEIPKAKAHVAHALQLHPNLADAHAVAGRLALFYDWDRATAEEAFDRALDLEPNSPFILSHYSDFLSLTDRHDEAIAVVNRATELDPLSTFVNTNAGERILHAGRIDEAIDALQHAIALDPGYYYSHFLLGFAFKATMNLEKAIAEFEIALDASGRAPIVAANLANCYWRFGKPEAADSLLNEIEELAQHQYVPPCFLFAMYNARGEREKAYTWFECALEERDFMAPFCVNWPDDDLHFPDEARYTAKLRKVGLLQ